MTTRRRRQTRARRTTGFDPWLHNRLVATEKALRHVYRTAVEAQRTLRRLHRTSAPFLATLAAFLAPMSPAVAQEIERERQWQRRARVDACVFCVAADSMTPMHDPSPRCESGGYQHCTCDTCY